MTTNPLSPEGILKDLHEIYIMCLGRRKYSVAFKIKELLGREAGLFSPKNKVDKISLDTLTDEDIARLIEELEARHKQGT